MSILRSRRIVGVAGTNSEKDSASNGSSFSTAANLSTKENTEGKCSRRLLLSYVNWILVAVYVTCVYLLCQLADNHLVKPLPATAPTNLFSEGRARITLKKFASFGSKPSGSYEAEVLTRNAILDEIDRIKRLAKRSHVIQVDVQKADDCYEFHFLIGFVSCYKNITNIAVKLSPAAYSTETAVLVNCHFDSVVGSPGATDDLTACSVMLEMLYVLTQSESSLVHNVIFLFNGAEENFMQGSHAFITKHKWRHEARAFINMEGAGAGGREFLFQSGPANMWLLHAYLDSAKYPHGSILAQEVFESGVIISDTDFRVFRDFGRLSGLDLAFTRNSYLYHTEYDDEAHIAPGSLQQLGENMLATLKTIANSNCLLKPCPDKEEKVVFFDVLGMFVVQYPRKYATVVNYVVCLLVLLKIYYHIRTSDQQSNNPGLVSSTDSDVRYSYADFGSQLLTILISMLAVLLTAVLTVQFVCISSLSMFWFSRWMLLLVVYIVPQVCAGLSVHVWLRLPWMSKRLKKANCFLMEQLNYDVMLMILASLLFFITFSGIQSTYYVLIHLLFPMMRDSLVNLVCRFKGINRTCSILFACQMITVFPAVLVGSYAVIEVLNVFIPLMGRSGAALNPEVLVVAICFTISMAFVIFLSNLVYISGDLRRVIKWTFAVNFLLLVILCFPGIVEPFQYSPEAPTWRRLHTQHVRRRIPAAEHPGAEIIQESGLWFAPLDYRGINDLPHDYFVQHSSPIDCHNMSFDKFCALPYYIPARKIVPPEKTLWVGTADSAPQFETPTSIELLSKKYVDKDRIVMNFEIKGADHISAYFTGLNDWYVDYFVFNTKPVALSDVMETYFVYFANVQIEESWKFSVAMFTTNQNFDHKRPILYVGAASHQMHGPFSQSTMLKNVSSTVGKRRQRSHPGYHWKWAMTVNSWTSDYLGKYAFYGD